VLLANTVTANTVLLRCQYAGRIGAIHLRLAGGTSCSRGIGLGVWGRGVRRHVVISIYQPLPAPFRVWAAWVVLLFIGVER
jgi:hypothetical protein